MGISVKGLLAVVLALTPGWAIAYRAINRHEVFPVSDTVFEVVSEVGASAADYWCGAGDFVRNSMRAGATQRIYIHRGLGPSLTRPGKKGVHFTLIPPQNADTTPALTLSVKAVGDNMTSAMAYQYCLNNNLLDPFPRRGW